MSILFTPCKLGSLTVRNRFVRSATCEGMCNAAGDVTPALVRYCERVARGGVGLFITGHTFVHPSGKASQGMMGACRDEQIPGLAQLASRVKTAGAAIAVQLNHGGRQCRSEIIGQTPLAPSAVTDRSSGITPRALTEAEIGEIIASYVAAAVRAKRAGFDAVQLHCAHGYLMSEFISPYTNRRTDRWGGSLENRARFILEVLRACRRELGRQYPIFIKLNGEDFIEGGLQLADTVEFAKMLEADGIAAIEVSGAMAESVGMVMRKNITAAEDEAYFLRHVEAVRKAVRVPLLCVGGLRSRQVMERIVGSGSAEFVSMSRPFIRQPDLPELMRQGKLDRASCVSCNRCKKDAEEGLQCALDAEAAEK